MEQAPKNVRWLEPLGNQDVAMAGGKNASLGEMIRSLQEQGVRVPGGFATTADVYREFIRENDLTQLIMGVDRDSGKLKALFNERNNAVKTAIRDVIQRAHQKGCKVGICKQAPSVYPEFAQFLVECGIDSMSLNPDSVISVIRILTGQ